MENGDESLGFDSNSLLSDVASSYEVGTSSEHLSLIKLSSCFEKLVVDSEYDYNDADIEVEGTIVGVNRGILAARSQFFHVLFKSANDSTVKIDKLKYIMSDLVPNRRIGHEALRVTLYFLYTGRIKDFPMEVSTCVDGSCAHDACGPAIDCAVQMMYASVKFQIKELVMFVQGRLIDFANKACVEDVIPILIVAFHCELKQLQSHCVRKIALSNLDDIVMEKELPEQVSTGIKSRRIKSMQEGSHDTTQENSINDRYIRKIHKALDLGDIALLNMLLDESNVTLDEACALHYAAAYCDTKTVIGLLSLNKADINLRNSRGYTVLHIAARRRDPYVVIQLLERDASVHDTTLDGQTSLEICRRLTRPRDFTQEKQRGLLTNKDRLCIDMLERKMGSASNPPAGNVLDSAMGLLYFENRVELARKFFPLEAELAMQVAEATSTTEFSGLSANYEDSDGNFGEVDLTETTSDFVKRQQRLLALQRTVATGRRYFPHCSEFLDNLAADDTLGTLFLDKGTPEERIAKKARYMEIMEDFDKAFDKDVAESERVRGVSSCSSASSSLKDRANQKVGKSKK
ncbi:BTB/POZ domain and ankyrin repeat-containing protein NPR1-like [Henckelia pumila]|uniref:BTB/POZ domain and ankyrin repeat-containing protein NPR1-like n=1 Tax=Henckelia pumila TaxID=405737 RepID=UPI003C6E62B7